MGWGSSVIADAWSPAIHSSGDKKGIIRVTQGVSYSMHVYMCDMCVRIHACVCFIHGYSKLYQYDGSETQFANKGKICSVLYSQS